MRRPLIAANWKMYKTLVEAQQYLSVMSAASFPEDVDKVLCVPSPYFLTLAQGDICAIGAQNCYWELEGAFTGEVSVPMLSSLDISYVIIGHSERRAYFQETDEIVNMKLKAVLDGGIIPILCIGESLEKREQGKTKQVVERQLLAAIQNLTSEEKVRLVIAYEPIWAIGTGKTASAADAQEVISYIRTLLPEKEAEHVRILYGGSVNPDNIAQLAAQPDIDGALVGGASLDVQTFIKLITITSSVRKLNESS